MRDEITPDLNRPARPRMQPASPGVCAAAPVLALDWTRCDGHGLCLALLPNSVRRDDWGYPILDQAALAEESERDRARAVSACPSLALRRWTG